MDSYHKAKTKLEVGDWVKGKTRKGTLILGFLVKIKPNNSKVVLKVINSDNKQMIGNLIRLEKRQVSKMESVKKYTINQLEGLIDLALLTKDEKWFMELTTELKKRQEHPLTTSGKVIMKDNFERTKE